MADSPVIRSRITGVLLAGGRAQRMGGQDKGLVPVAGRPMAAWVLEALRPQVAAVIINANRNRESYAGFGHPVVADALEGYCGPLAGMASAMAAAETPYILTAPCDSPFLPGDLAARLYRALEVQQAEIAAAHDGERLQPVFALLATDLRASLEAYLAAGERKIDRWFQTRRLAVVDFSDQPRTFLNLNTPEELAAVEAQLP